MYLASNLVDDLTAENLLLVYLTRTHYRSTILGLDACTRIANQPAITSPNTTLDLTEKLNNHFGKPFSEEESDLVMTHLSKFVETERLKNIMSMIETGSDVSQLNQLDYGVAQAICHAASGEIQQTLEVSDKAQTDLLDTAANQPILYSSSRAKVGAVGTDKKTDSRRRYKALGF